MQWWMSLFSIQVWHVDPIKYWLQHHWNHPQKGYSHLTWFLPGIDTVARCLLAGCGMAKDLLYGRGCSAWPFQQCCPQFWQGQNFKPQPTNNRSLELYYYVRGKRTKSTRFQLMDFPWWFPTTARTYGAAILWIWTSNFHHVNCNSCVW